mgnify:CR=1 FL=1
MSFAKSDNFNLDLDLLSGFEFFDTIKNLDLDFTGSTDLDSDCKKIRYLPPNLIKLSLTYKKDAVIPWRLPSSLKDLEITGYLDDDMAFLFSTQSALTQLISLKLKTNRTPEDMFLNCFCFELDLSGLEKLQKLDMEVCTIECLKKFTLPPSIREVKFRSDVPFFDYMDASKRKQLLQSFLYWNLPSGFKIEQAFLERTNLALKFNPFFSGHWKCKTRNKDDTIIKS